MFELFKKNIYLKNIAQILKKKNLTLTTAESCTGGLLSSMLTDVSGSSEFIKENFITYANEAKIKLLSVDESVLAKYGAVSEATAAQMVLGLLKNTNADFAISTTGIAGPTGGTTQKPVGLVYIGVADKKEFKVIKYNANPLLCRKFIKYLFAVQALRVFNEFLAERGYK